MSKGIITTSGKIIANPSGGGFRVQSSLTPADMNYYALYWDKVIFPQNGFIGIEVPHEEDLKKYGLIETPFMPRDGMINWGKINDLMVDDVLITANRLRDERADYDWFIHQMSDSGIHTSGDTRKLSLRLDLVNLLPVPGNQIPIAEVLEFKLRRADELKEMHEHIDKLYLCALGSPDFELSRSSAISDLKQAVQNLDRVSHDKWGLTSKFNFSLSIEPDLFAIGRDFAIGGLTTGSLSIALMAGLAGAIKITPKQEFVFEHERKSKGVMYIANASREGLLS